MKHYSSPREISLFVNETVDNQTPNGIKEIIERRQPASYIKTKRRTFTSPPPTPVPFLILRVSQENLFSLPLCLNFSTSTTVNQCGRIVSFPLQSFSSPCFNRVP